MDIVLNNAIALNICGERLSFRANDKSCDQAASRRSEDSSGACGLFNLDAFVHLHAVWSCYFQ